MNYPPRVLHFSSSAYLWTNFTRGTILATYLSYSSSASALPVTTVAHLPQTRLSTCSTSTYYVQ
ncbi:hypothetical protein EXN66_Car002717 [Channa argus]|uniref:Uncharacterized protein n=1 Tax=Channa argus TaxID=215402 RepID=A0A6G1P9V8_CHAAH|nr:hypothetical protein EXN66_Car002717 [Channa argus]